MKPTKKPFFAYRSFWKEFDAMKRFAQSASDRQKALEFDAPAILINAWNEWSEGMALLPDNWNQDGFLRKLAETVQP